MNKREWMLQGAIAAVRSGKNFDDHDMATALGALYDAIVAASPEPADSGWIEHRGEKPYPEGRVDVRYRSKMEEGGDADDFIWEYGLEEPEWEIEAWRPA